jgi:hypothetical protein
MTFLYLLSFTNPMVSQRSSRRMSLLGVAIGALLCFAIATTASAKNIALLIGIAEYPSRPLYGPVNDVKALKARLPKIGFAESDIVTLVDAQATKAGIMREIARLYDRSASGDEVLIYFSGHGTSEKDPKLALPLLHDSGAWMPHGFILVDDPKEVASKLIIGRTDLQPIIKKLDSSGRKVTIISDSCFSGNLARSVRLSSSNRPVTRDFGGAVVLRSAGGDDVFATSTSLSAGTRPPRPPWPFNNVVQLTSASDDQPSVDLARPQDLALATGGVAHGVFTEGLLRLLDGRLAMTRQTGNAPNFVQLHQALVDYMASVPPELQSTPSLLPAVTDNGARAVERSFAQFKPPTASIDSAPANGARVTLSFRDIPADVEAKWRTNLPSNVDVVPKGGAFVLARQSEGGSVGVEDRLYTNKNDFVTASPQAIRRRLAAESWLRDALPKTAPSAGLRADTRPTGVGGVFLFGDALRFTISLREAAQLLVIALDSNGEFAVLFPANGEEARTVAAGQTVTIPSESPNDCIKVGPPVGLDRVAVVALQPGSIPTSWRGAGVTTFASEDARATNLRSWLSRSKGEVVWVDVNTQPRQADSRAPYACSAATK